MHTLEEQTFHWDITSTSFAKFLTIYLPVIDSWKQLQFTQDFPCCKIVHANAPVDCRRYKLAHAVGSNS